MQRWLETESIDQVPLNLECRDEIIPILRTVQHLNAKSNEEGNSARRTAFADSLGRFDANRLGQHVETAGKRAGKNPAAVQRRS